MKVTQFERDGRNTSYIFKKHTNLNETELVII